MQLIEILYLTASAAAVIAMAPQVRQLFITKQSDELSLMTWGAWTVTQFVSFAYAISLGAVPFIVTNVAWIAFYMIMLILIVKYRKRPARETPVILENTHLRQSRLATVPVTVK